MTKAILAVVLFIMAALVLYGYLTSTPPGLPATRSEPGERADGRPRNPSLVGYSAEPAIDRKEAR